ESKQDRPYDVQCSTRNCRRSRLRCCIGRDDVADGRSRTSQSRRARRLWIASPSVLSSAASNFHGRAGPQALTFGLLLSLPSAIITKAYAPVLVVGALGGLIIGGVIHGWLPRA